MARQYYRNPYSTRRPPERSPAPSLAGVWLLIGIFMGVGIMGLAYIFYSPVLPQPLRFGAEQITSGEHQIAAQEAEKRANIANAQGKTGTKTNKNAKNSNNSAETQGRTDGQRFEFYTLLPGMEVALPDQKPEAKASKRIDPKMAATSGRVNDGGSNTGVVTSRSQNANVRSQNEVRNYQGTHQETTDPRYKGSPAIREQSRTQKELASGQKTPSNTNTLGLAVRQQGGEARNQLAQNRTSEPQMTKQNGIIGSSASVKYIVQAGLFQSLKDADALKARLTLQGFQPRLQKIETREGSSWFRVTLGPFPSESQAQTQKQRLENQKIHGILIMQRPNG